MMGGANSAIIVWNGNKIDELNIRECSINTIIIMSGEIHFSVYLRIFFAFGSNFGRHHRVSALYENPHQNLDAKNRQIWRPFCSFLVKFVCFIGVWNNRSVGGLVNSFANRVNGYMVRWQAMLIGDLGLSSSLIVWHDKGDWVYRNDM